jgi:hypothetical protein
LIGEIKNVNAIYDSVIERLRAKGIRVEFQRPHQLVLPSRVWITWNEQWYVSTWMPAVYPVPSDVDVVSLCEECLQWHDDPFYTMPEPICHRYRLSRMAYDDFARVCLIPPDDDGDDEP